MHAHTPPHHLTSWTSSSGTGPIQGSGTHFGAIEDIKSFKFKTRKDQLGFAAEICDFTENFILKEYYEDTLAEKYGVILDIDEFKQFCNTKIKNFVALHV